MESSSRPSTTLAAAAILVIIIAINISTVAEGSKGPDVSIVKGPECEGKSKNSGYDKNVLRLLDLLLRETKNTDKREYGGYRYTGSYPNDGSGSATGGATCDGDLGKTECLGCLVAAKRKLSNVCRDEPIKASVKLRDCSLWYDKACGSPPQLAT